jgi:hypothetical protein
VQVKILIILTLGMITSCSPITFPSAESRTTTGEIVFNKVSWKREGKVDRWMMRQSHQGAHLASDKWDELMITVEDRRVSFHQLKNGKEIAPKVSCIMCHPNGPRAIRPLEGADLTLLEKAQIVLMNLRVKTYGKLDVPYKSVGSVSDAPLKLEACMKCHQDEGFLSRGFLRRQNSMSIKFMVENEHMPPLGSLELSEKKYLEEFMAGF